MLRNGDAASLQRRVYQAGQAGGSYEGAGGAYLGVSDNANGGIKIGRFIQKDRTEAIRVAMTGIFDIF